MKTGRQSYVFDRKMTQKGDELDIGEAFESIDDLFDEWDKLWEEANPGEHR